MATGRSVLCVLAFCTVCGQVWSQGPISDLPQVQIEPSGHQEVIEGHPYHFVCRLLGRSISYCSVQTPGGARFNLHPGQQGSPGVEYSGAGFERGECGARVARVEVAHNGSFVCGMGLAESMQEAVGSARLVVKPAPLLPELTVQQHYEQYNMASQLEYREGETLRASCKVTSREQPAADITWFLDQTLLGLVDADMVSNVWSPSPLPLGPGLVVVRQEVMVVLGWRDHGRRLRCVARYPEGPGGDRAGVAEEVVHVAFAPQPSEFAITEMPLTREGEDGVVTAVVHANPRPQLLWRLNGGEVGRGGRYVAEMARQVSDGQWEARLRIPQVTVNDLGTTFHLTASNQLGNQTYLVRISAQRQNSYLIGIGSIAVGLAMLIAASVILVVVIAALWRRHRSEVLMDTIA